MRSISESGRGLDAPGPCIQLASIDSKGRGVWKRRRGPDRGVKQGAVAQLGERLICTQEVAGSIPTSSTSGSAGGLVCAAGDFRTWARSSDG